MPIYAYRCEACGFAKDALQKIADAPLTDCESCGKPALKKQLTAAGFQLKGSGWYVTDFRNGSGGKPESKDGKSESRDGSAGAPTPGAGADSAAASTTAKSSSEGAADSKPATPAPTPTAT